MFPTGVWSWFGIRVLPSWQVAYRVVTVEPQGDGLYRVEVYDCGETGELWYKRRKPLGKNLRLDEAIFIADRHVRERCWKYETVETKRAEAEAPTDAPPSVAGWWLKVLGVEPDAPVDKARAAYRSRLHKYHPDGHMDESETARAAWGRKTQLVIAAWERYREMEGIK